MNFLSLRSNQTAASEPKPAQESQAQENPRPRHATTLEGLIAEDPFPPTPSSNIRREWSERFGSDSAGFNTNNNSSQNHTDVTEDEGWINIPYKELPENWIETPDILAFRSLDRCFVFPGEQVHILACLSACKQDTDIITPFKVAAAMSKNGFGQSPKKKNGNIADEPDHASNVEKISLDGHDNDQNGNNASDGKVDPSKDVSDSESFLRMEGHRKKTETLLQRFRNSHFFVRIADSNELLWSKRRESGSDAESSSNINETFDGAEIRTAAKKSSISVAVDKGGSDYSSSGGLARNSVQCYSLPNGDIVVLLQVNVGIDLLQDPVLEILQYDKYQEKSFSSGKQENLVPLNKDPCGDLLKWLLPLDNSVPPPSRPVSPPHPSLSTSIRTASSKPNLSGSSSSQIFSFGHFRSYSMSSLPPNTTPPPPVVASNSKPNFDTDDWNQFSYKNLGKPEKTGHEGLLSFRGVSLEPERFSVRCGLEGIYIPGKRWRRKIEMIQPVDIHSFSAECNTEDLLCVQIKNVSPAHTPDIMLYLDAIMIIFEKASKGGPPSSVPIACIEAGNDHSLPNLALRRGEEHSFILKPVTSMWKTPKVPVERNIQPSHSRAGSVSSSIYHPINVDETASNGDQYAVLVSCRCNYTESRLFFKKPTSWRPHISRDVLISVASEMSKQTLLSNGRVPQLPVQVLTLQASNLTSEDLTMTVLAPDSFMSPPSVLSLNSSPTSPLSPYVGSSESAGRVHKTKSLPIELESQISTGGSRSRSVIPSEQLFTISDVLPRGDLGCTHLWLQSRVPLGCVPARSTATIKLELLPLTDGIITLDSLQINIKEKGQTYIPEYSLKINATSSIATGII